MFSSFLISFKNSFFELRDSEYKRALTFAFIYIFLDIFLLKLDILLKVIFAESIYKILFSKMKKNHHAVINKIKSNCSSSNEANYIIRMATTDFSNTRKH